MFWEELRAASNDLSTRACKGEGPAEALLRHRAETVGDPTAQVSLAWLTLNKKCVYFTGDEAKATDLNLRASITGYPLAMSNFGMRLAKGIGTPPDPDAAVPWLTASADGGHATAALNLAGLYTDGKYIPRDRDEALYWLDRAERDGADPEQVSKARARFSEAFGDTATNDATGSQDALQAAYQQCKARFDRILTCNEQACGAYRSKPEKRECDPSNPQSMNATQLEDCLNSSVLFETRMAEYTAWRTCTANSGCGIDFFRRYGGDITECGADLAARN